MSSMEDPKRFTDLMIEKKIVKILFINKISQQAY